MGVEGNRKISLCPIQLFLFKPDTAFQLHESMGKNATRLFKVESAFLNLDRPAFSWIINR